VSQCEANFILKLITFLMQGRLYDVKLILDKSLNSASLVSRSEFGALYLYDGQLLRQISHSSLVLYDNSSNQSSSMNLSVYSRFGPGIGLTGTCFSQQKPIVSDDLVHDRRSIVSGDEAAQRNLRACAAVPISLRESAIGVITVVRTVPKVYEPDLVSTLSVLAKKIALCLHHCIYFPDFTDEWLQAFSEYQLGDGFEPKKLPEAKRLEGLKAGDDIQLNDVTALPKGMQPATLQLVWNCLQGSEKPLTCNQVADITGFSTVTARRYLNYMADARMIKRKLQYGNIGRPGFLYLI